MRTHGYLNESKLRFRENKTDYYPGNNILGFLSMIRYDQKYILYPLRRLVAAPPLILN